MRHTVRLVVREDQEYGGVGLAPKKAREENFNPSLDGRTVAHDLLEHINGAAHIGDICDELEALGALWFIRGQFGDLSRDGRGSNYTTEENLASDLVRMFRESFYGAFIPPTVPTTRAHDEDDNFREIIRIAARDWAPEVDTDQEAEAAQMWPHFAALCLAHMRRGYRKASRKYRDDAHSANALFWEVARCVDGLVKRGGLEEGAEYVLTYGLDWREPFASWDYADGYAF